MDDNQSLICNISLHTFCLKVNRLTASVEPLDLRLKEIPKSWTHQTLF